MAGNHRDLQQEQDTQDMLDIQDMEQLLSRH